MFTQLVSGAILTLPMLAYGSPVIVRTESSYGGSSDSLSAFEPNTTAWKDGASDSFCIWRDSCNTTQSELIGEGLAQAMKLVEHGRDHLRRFGNDSYFQRWFGNNNNPFILEGLYDRISFRSGVSVTPVSFIFVPGTGEGGTDHQKYYRLTVVCPTYYLSKAPSAELCINGETIASQGSEYSAHDAVDLAEGVNATQSIIDIHSVQYYALDVYAADILLPGEGCLGNTSIKVADKE
uniref:Putative peptidase domain-containing protein n=1 Tax=Kwoniella pini CBS 10737 TaxID=1296096 RepID=A0A1B9HUL0_9TREE|nr:uncharacterized protein I206_06730 [Kwoniella pini CBS 10737]OCF46956.1 hypothetical protein I206_06730 [Kwoniella pini CBS 10737]